MIHITSLVMEKMQFNNFPCYKSMGSVCCYGNQTKRQITIILAIFKLPYPSKTGREEDKTDFHDGLHGSHLQFLIGMILAIFYLQVAPDTSYQVSSQLAFQFRRRSPKLIFKMVAILDFTLERV